MSIVVEVSEVLPAHSASENRSPSADSWMPTVYTPPLSAEFTTDGDRLLEFIGKAWKNAETAGEFELDAWQVWLIRHVLETYPPDWPVERLRGTLRFREALCSMGRQNGKSVLGAIFALYGLMLQCPGPNVIGVAQKTQTANVVYRRVKFVIDSNAALAKRFKATGTRGIYSRDEKKPATYRVVANNEDALQGEPITLCIYDEVHLCPQEAWDAVKFGTSAQPSAMVLGITTAGDDDSLLLKDLYKRGHQAAGQDGDYDERLGFFLWEAPEHLDIVDPVAIKAANPSVACGRLHIDDAINVIKGMREQSARRYRLNQFVASESTWLPTAMWQALERGEMPSGGPLYVTVERSLKYEHAAFIASTKVDGHIYTQVIASVSKPSIDRLEEMCVAVAASKNVDRFFMPSATLRNLSDRLRENGYPVEYLTTTQMSLVCAQAYSLIAEKAVTLGNTENVDVIVDLQMPRGVAKNTGEGWRISARDSSGDVDALMATLIGMYAAEVTKPYESQMQVW